LRAVRETGGAIEAVTDEEVVAGIQLLGETEGIFAETAGGVTIGTLARLARSGAIRPDERVVAMITGHGLKTAEVLTDRLGPSITIEPSLGRFDAAIDALVTSTAP
jgi:threonine synthase